MTAITNVVKTYERDAGRIYVVHFRDGGPVWELAFYVEAGRVAFLSACWTDGEPVECPAPVRTACHAAVRRQLRRT